MNCQEGERRGLMAELLSTSYLYSLSKHDEIDAQFAGSLMKFANNSFEGMINTVAKIIFVEGRRHIVLYASRQIENGEEIFFDYGYGADKRKQIDWLSAFTKKYFFNMDQSKEAPKLKQAAARKTMRSLQEQEAKPEEEIYIGF